MSDNRKTGQAAVNGAQLYYEIAGDGLPLVMLHAGVADHRQWNNEFAHFAGQNRVLRYDRRGFGQSEPVDGEYRDLDDLAALLDHLGLDGPLVLMGCSMGGGLALDFALTHPARTKGLVMVASGPGGLMLDVDDPWADKFEAAEKAFHAGDLDLASEIETQVWFDGLGRTPDDVNPDMRQLAFEMKRLALGHSAKELGKRLPNIEPPAAGRLAEVSVPVLIIVGEHDEPYTQAAADHMVAHMPNARQVRIEDAAHLSNMDHPVIFQQALSDFLKEL